MAQGSADPSSGAIADNGEDEVVMTLDNAVHLAIAYQRDGHLTNAEALWRQILEAHPDEGRANHYLGLLLHQSGRPAEARPYLDRSRVLCPDDVSVAVNLALVAMQAGEFDAALKALDDAIAREPDLADAHANRGIVLRALGRLGDAEAAHKKALDIDAQHGPALANLARLLAATGREEEALTYAMKSAAGTHTGRDGSLRLVGTALTRLGRRDEARAHYRRWLEAEPDNPFATHALAALSDAPPERCSDAYVRRMFDEAAADFDQRLGALHYRVPREIEALLERCEAARTLDRGGLSILDAGCGTGLCAPFLKPRAAMLTGVDLSDGMLSRANELGVYDRLENADITAFMRAHREAYDLIVAADVVVYFGALDGLFSAVANALRGGGLFVASCENAPQAETFVVGLSGRYAHRRQYVDATLVAAGFTLEAAWPVSLRKEHGLDVDGWVFAAALAPGEVA